MDSFHGETVVRKIYRSGFYNLGVKDCLICRSTATNELSTMPRMEERLHGLPHADGNAAELNVFSSMYRRLLASRRPSHRQRLIERRYDLGHWEFVETLAMTV